MKNNRSKKGFTLIELLVVVLIIGILAAIAMPQYQKAVNKAKMAELKTFMGNAKRAVEIYIMENGISEDSLDLLNSGMLAISLTDGMTCEASSSTCYGKYFGYYILCSGGNICEITAFKNKDENNWFLTTLVTSDGRNWTPDSIYYQEDEPQAKALCQDSAQTFGGSCHLK